MAYCTKCGAEILSPDAPCQVCGYRAPSADSQKASAHRSAPKVTLPLSGRLMAILSYFGILVFIPAFFSDRNDSSVRFHAVQGFNVFVLGVIRFILKIVFRSFRVLEMRSTLFGMVPSYILPWYLSLILTALSIITLILSVIGIANVVRGREEELPLIGRIHLLDILFPNR